MTADRPVRVLIVDDQRVVRDGLSVIVALLDGVDVVEAVSDGLQAVRAATSGRPDVVLMDLHMPVCDGVEATRRIRRESPDVHILVLSTYADDADLLAALEAGAEGYLTKDAAAEEIHRAILDVAEGRTHLDAGIQRRLVAGFVTSPPPRDGPDKRGAPPDGLTAREVEVLQMIAHGLSNAEIARDLVLSSATVKTHVNHIFTKTGVRDRSQAVRYAYQNNLAPRGN